MRTIHQRLDARHAAITVCSQHALCGEPLIGAARYTVPPLLLGQGRYAGRNGHRLDAPRAPERDGRAPCPTAAQVDADNRPAIPHADRPARIPAPNRPTREQHGRFVAARNVQPVRQEPRFEAAVPQRALSRSSSSVARNDGEIADQRIAAPDLRPLVPLRRVALKRVHERRSERAVAHQVVPPSAPWPARASRCRRRVRSTARFAR